MDKANDFILLHDIEGRSVYASASVERLYSQWLTFLFEFAHPDDLEQGQDWWKRVVTGGSERLQWRVEDRNGNWRWLETSASDPEAGILDGRDPGTWIYDNALLCGPRLAAER